MKITRARLKQIIKEELESVVYEGKADLGRELESYLKVWAKGWSGQVEGPLDALDAWYEVAAAIVVEGGLWKSTVPEQWLGCNAAPESPGCQNLNNHFKKNGPKNDRLIGKVEKVLDRGDERYATRFIANPKNFKSLLGLLKFYVPLGKDSTSVFETPMGQIVNPGQRGGGGEDDL